MITPQPGGAVYRQLAELLRQEILSGRLQPGQKLPSETTLVQRYGIARETARRAVAVLRAEGIVGVVRGHGVVVREQPTIQDLTPTSGSTITARMPTADERAELEVPEGVPVIAVVAPDGGVEVYPAHRWRLRWPSS
ncbi:winged helix-turn-helix domain-containing protein [Actinoplanes sp. CA-051413]|uniref:winged helix-turn-helix domain-containing protein n=1 Tax=Actinoplanes sp. CA-051413 TaxID=3239899 RepID=UPI003D95A44E